MRRSPILLMAGAAFLLGCGNKTTDSAEPAGPSANDSSVPGDGDAGGTTPGPEGGAAVGPQDPGPDRISPGDGGPGPAADSGVEPTDASTPSSDAGEGPTQGATKQGECDNDISSGQEEVTAEADGMDIVVRHTQGLHNSCAVIRMDLEARGPILDITETITNPDGLCFGQCLLDLETRITGLDKGLYTVRIWDDKHRTLRGEVQVQVPAPGGDTCDDPCDCEQFMLCKNGRCEWGNPPGSPNPCSSDIECPCGEICDTGSGLCAAAIEECLDGCDCPALHMCLNGSCAMTGGVIPDCASDAECFCGNLCQDKQCMTVDQLGCAAEDFETFSPVECHSGGMMPDGDYALDTQAKFDEFIRNNGCSTVGLPEINWANQMVVGVVRSGSGCSAEGAIYAVHRCGGVGYLRVSYSVQFRGMCDMMAFVYAFAVVPNFNSPVQFN